MMHFFMDVYLNVATMAGLDRYGLCEEKCYDRVPFGSTVGMLLMNRLEEDWGGKVTWSSSWELARNWLLEEVDIATVF